MRSLFINFIISNKLNINCIIIRFLTYPITNRWMGHPLLSIVSHFQWQQTFINATYPEFSAQQENSSKSSILSFPPRITQDFGRQLKGITQDLPNSFQHIPHYATTHSSFTGLNSIIYHRSKIPLWYKISCNLRTNAIFHVDVATRYFSGIIRGHVP